MLNLIAKYVKYVETRSPIGEHLLVISPKDDTLLDVLYECVSGNEIYRLISEGVTPVQINSLFEDGYDIPQYKVTACRLVMEGEPRIYIYAVYLDGLWIFSNEKGAELFSVDDETGEIVDVARDSYKFFQIISLCNIKTDVAH